MDSEFLVSLGVKFDESQFANLKNQINSLSNNTIKLKIDTENTKSQFLSIKKEIQSLNNSKIINKGNFVNIDIKSTNEATQAYKDLLKIQNQLNSKRTQLIGLDSEKDIHQIEELRFQLNRLSADYNNLYQIFSRSFSTDQLDELNRKFETTSNKITVLKAKSKDLDNLSFNDIKNKFDNNINSDIEKIVSGLNKIKTQSEETSIAYQKFDNAVKNMSLAKQSGDVNKLRNSYKEYVLSLKEVFNQIKINQREEKGNFDVERLNQSKVALSSKIDIWLKNNSAAAKQFGSQLTVLKSQIESVDGTGLKNLESEFQEITRQAQLSGVATQSWGDRFSNSISQLSTYFSAAALIQKSMQAMRYMYDSVLNVDNAMTELYRVTDLTDTQYSHLYDNMVKSAKTYNSELSTIISSTASWVRLGFDETTSNRLAEITAMYQHVTDLDEQTAVDNLVTAYKGYQEQLLAVTNGDSAAAILKIADIYDKMGNEFALSAADVGSGLSQTASALQLADNSIEESAGMITGITEVTQDPDKAGNALKTLSLRLRGMKGELQELGEEVDENVESLSKMQTQVLNLTKGKVNIFNDDGSFKSTYEIMQGISEVYKELTDTEQADLLEIIAGKNRANDVAALISNWSQVEKATKAAYNAEGTAQAEQDKYAQGLQGRIDSLTASLQTLSNNFLSSDLLKNAVNDLNVLVDGIDWLISKLGSIPTLIGAVSTALSFKNIGIFQTINSDLTSFSTGISKATNKIGILGSSLADLKNAYNTAGVKGIKNSLADTSTSLITEMDKQMLESYNVAIDAGTPKVQALKETMAGASKGARELAMNANGAKVNLDGVAISANTSKTAMLGLQVATMAANVAFSMVVSWGISQIISGIASAYNEWANAAQNASDEAQRQASETKDLVQKDKEKANSLQELIDKYKELAQSTDINFDTRSEIANVQSQITSLVGEQAKNLDLVNGKLSEQLNILTEIQGQNIQEQYNNAYAAYSAAVEATKKYRGTNTTAEKAIYGNTFKTDNNVLKVLSPFLDNSRNNLRGKPVLGSQYIYDKNGAIGFDYSIDLSNLETATEKANRLQEAMDALKEAGYQNTEVFNTLNTQWNEWNNLSKSEVEATDNLISATIDFLKQSNKELLNTSADSVDEIQQYKTNLLVALNNDTGIQQAILDGNLSSDVLETKVNTYISTIEGFSDYYLEWKAKFLKESTSTNNTVNIQEPKLSFSEVVSEESFDKSIDTYLDNMNKLRDAMDKIEEGKMEDSDIAKLIKEFPELAKIPNVTKDMNALSLAIEKQGKELTGHSKVVNADGNVMSEATGIIALFSDAFGQVDSEEDITALQNFQDAVFELGEIVGSTEFAIDIDTEIGSMDNLWKAMKESVSSTGLTADSIKNLKARYQDLEKYNAAKIFEKTNNGIHLNTNALRELESAYEKQQKNKVDTQLETLIGEYDRLSVKIDKTSDASQRAELYAKRDEIKSQIDDVSILATEYEGLTSAFNKWEQAQSIGEEGDMYDSLTGSLEDIKKLYDDGLIGTNKFRAAVQLMSNEDLSTASAEKLVEVYESSYDTMTRYFQDSSNGALNFLNDIQELNSEWVHLNEDGKWDINFGVGNDEEIANALGINVESVQAILRKLSDYGFDINLDTIYSRLDVLKTYAENANEKLIELGKTDINFNFAETNLDKLDEQIKDSQDLLDSFRDSNGEVNLNLSGAEEAQYVLASLISQKQTLNAPAIMDIDTSNAETDIDSLIKLLQDYQINYNNLEIQTAIGADTTEAESRLQSIAEEIQSFDNEAKISIGLDDTNIESIKSSIMEITPEILVEAGIDTTKVDEYEPENEDAIVEYNIDHSKVDAYKPDDKDGWVNYRPRFIEETVPTLQGTVNYLAKYASVQVGSARANGTTPIDNQIGEKDSKNALVGELGKEVLVRDNQYYVLGENGAEFFDYKRGDIIFNAKQSQQLLKNGRITTGNRRGKALVNGNARGRAFSNGIGKIYGGGSVKTTKTTASSSNSIASSNSKTSSEKEEKEFEETIDWIEIAIDRIERAISTLDTKAKSIFSLWSDRNKRLREEISKVTEEIDIQQKGYTRYLKQAESVGLDANTAKDVRDGKIDITTITDEDLSEKISLYQQWYEKAIDCRDAVVELNETVSELYQTAFENIVTEYDGIVSIVEHEQSMLEEYISQSEEKGYITSIKYYEALMRNQRENIVDLESKKSDLIFAMDDAINSGAIKEGSEEWHEMISEIDNVTLAIEQGGTTLLEYSNAIRDIKWQIFDLLQERISNVTTEADFLIELLQSSNDLLKENGQLTNEGKSVMGLYAVNYNTYMSQADDYAKEILSISKQLSDDPANQDLVNRKEELLELQQESILAAENEKKAISDLVKEGIETELDSLKNLIDTYKEALDSEKDLYDYQKKIKEQTKEITSLEKQMQAYGNDTSEEARTTVQKLKVSLEEAKTNLQETQYDQYISDQKKLLDELYLGYETTLNKRLDDLDALISDMIISINNNSGVIAETLYTTVDKVGYIMSDSMDIIWKEAYEAILNDSDKRVEQSIKTINQLVENGKITKENADKILEALKNGDSVSTQNALEQIRELVNNGEITKDTANNIISSLSLSEQTSVLNTLKLLDKLVENGKITEQEANKIIDDIVNNDSSNAENIVNRLVSEGSLSREKADLIMSVLKDSNSSSNKTVEDVVSVYSRNFENKTTTTNEALSSIKILIENIIDIMNKDATTKISNPTTNSTAKSITANSNNKTNTPNNTSIKKINPNSNIRTDTDYYGVALAICNGNYGWGTGQDRIKKLESKGFNGTKTQNIVNQMIKDGYINSDAWIGKYKGIKDLSPYHYNKFAIGSKRINRNQMAWTQENGEEFIIRPSDGSVLTPLAKNDSVLTANATDNIWQMANTPEQFIKNNLTEVRSANNPVGNSTNNFAMNINLPNVYDYQQFKSALTHDSSFEKFVRSVTVDRMFGGNSLNKYKS